MTAPTDDRLLRIRPDRLERARDLRREMTFPERLLWSRLRAGQLAGVRFRRQAPIGPFVADFYCPQASLVIELDGESHDDSAGRDARRTAYLVQQGLRVVRFSDDEVLNCIDDVVYRISLEIGLEP